MTLNEPLFRFGNHTDIGQVRSENQDYMGYFDTLNGHLFVVCDGMGGHAGGEVASQLAVEGIRNFMQQQYYQDAESALQLAVQYANQKVYHQAMQRPDLRGMGTTCVAVIIRGSRLYYAHVGDSRLYYLHQGSLERLTKDHSFVQSLVDQGTISEDEAENHPQKNELSRALGTHSLVEVEVCDEPVDAVQGDIFLLCTDGLTNMLNEAKIEEIIAQPIDIQLKAISLVQTANLFGGTDNITVQVIDFYKADPLSPERYKSQQALKSLGSSSFSKTKPDSGGKYKSQYTSKNSNNLSAQALLQKAKQKTQQILPESVNFGEWFSSIPKGEYLTFGFLSIVSLLMAYVYFAADNALAKQLFGKNFHSRFQNPQDSAKNSTSLMFSLEKKLLNKAIDKSPFLRDVNDKYNQAKDTYEDVQDTYNEFKTFKNDALRKVRGVMSVVHKVERNETLQDISEKYGISIEELMKANKLKNARDIRKLDSLVIPVEKQPKQAKDKQKTQEKSKSEKR